MVSKVLERIVVALPRYEGGRPGLLRLLAGTVTAANLNRLKVVSHKSCRNPVHLVPRRRLRRRPNENPCQLSRNLRRVRGP